MAADVYFGKKIYKPFILSVSPHVTRRLLSTHFLVFYISWEQRRKAYGPYLHAQNDLCYLLNRTGVVDFKQKQLVFWFCRSAGAPRPSFEKTYGGFPRIEQTFYTTLGIFCSLCIWKLHRSKAKVYMDFKNWSCGPEIKLALEEPRGQFLTR